MPLPTSWTQVVVTGTLLKPDGSPHVGTVAFQSSEKVVIDSVVMVPHVQFARLDGNGSFSITLPSTDDPDIQPTGWTYTVTEFLPRPGVSRNMLVPGTVGTIAYSDLLAVEVVVNAPRVQTIIDASSITPDVSLYDTIVVTALARDLTINNPVPAELLTQGRRLLVRIKDDGTLRTLAWGSDFRAHGVGLPPSTLAGKNLYVGCIYDANAAKWDVITAV